MERHKIVNPKTRNHDLRVVCAWCGLVMIEGKEPATHGICDDCIVEMQDEYQRKTGINAA